MICIGNWNDCCLHRTALVYCSFYLFCTQDNQETLRLDLSGWDYLWPFMKSRELILFQHKCSLCIWDTSAWRNRTSGYRCMFSCLNKGRKLFKDSWNGCIEIDMNNHTTPLQRVSQIVCTLSQYQQSVFARFVKFYMTIRLGVKRIEKFNFQDVWNSCLDTDLVGVTSSWLEH